MLYTFTYTVLHVISQFLKSKVRILKKSVFTWITTCFVFYPRKDNTMAKNFQVTKCHTIASLSVPPLPSLRLPPLPFLSSPLLSFSPHLPLFSPTSLQPLSPPFSLSPI